MNKVVSILLVIVVALGAWWGIHWLRERSAARATTIEFAAMGSVDSQLLEEVARKTADIFGASYRIGDQIPIPQSAYDPSRQQYYALAMVGAVPSASEPGAPHRLAVTEVDIYAPEVRFYFGYWDMQGKRAVVSLARLRPEAYQGGSPNHDLLVRRAVAEAVHQLAHTYGIQHCAVPGCVMTPSISLADTDAKDGHFCEQCQPKVEQIMAGQ